jgi:DNA-binding NtrC family response regulator
LQGALADAAEEAPAASLTGGNEMILLVEDDEMVRSAFGICLRRAGYRVVEAAEGAEALDAWEKHEGAFALLITDMVMPGTVSGSQLAERLLNTNERLRIVVVTGYSSDHADWEGRFGSRIVRLAKPCGPELLLDTVRRALDAVPVETK